MGPIRAPADLTPGPFPSGGGAPTTAALRSSRAPAAGAGAGAGPPPHGAKGTGATGRDAGAADDVDRVDERVRGGEGDAARVKAGRGCAQDQGQARERRQERGHLAPVQVVAEEESRQERDQRRVGVEDERGGGGGD